jgi:asparagine synthase (glutamine-hydrolysing)
MSGIVGIYYLDGRPVDRADIQRMVDILAHRGPDGAGIWCEGPVGLGHLMLHDTPESLHETLPLVREDGDLVITSDARIDNRDELISLLRIERPSEEVCDSEMILTAYEKWGERCCERLLGDFAFAIWDMKNQKLFCARDHMGVKPFYYYRSGRLFAFATEIRALLCLSGVPRKLNEVRVAYYLARNKEDQAISFYQDIVRLPPAQVLIVDRERGSKRTYWNLDPWREIKLDSDDKYAEAFRAVFTEAVHCRLRSAFRVGSYLSGGVDSSSVTCVARNLLAETLRKRLHTFSAVFDDVSETDESLLINIVLAKGGFEHHFIRGDQHGVLEDLNKYIEIYDEPNFGPNVPWIQDIHESAKSSDVRVMLSGSGGDFVVSYGEDMLLELALKFRWMALARQVAEFSRNTEMPARSILRSNIIRPLIPELVLDAWRAVRINMRLPPDHLVNPALAKRIGLSERFRHVLRKPPIPLRTGRALHLSDLMLGVHSFSLQFEEMGPAANGIVIRHPFYDRRLVEFCLALPASQKMRNGLNRFIIRNALKETVPAEVIWNRVKAPFGPHFMYVLDQFERERLEALMTKDTSVIEEYVDVQALHKAYQRYVKLGSEIDGDDVWRVALLAGWLSHNGLV